MELVTLKLVCGRSISTNIKHATNLTKILKYTVPWSRLSIPFKMRRNHSPKTMTRDHLLTTYLYHTFQANTGCTLKCTSGRIEIEDDWILSIPEMVAASRPHLLKRKFISSTSNAGKN